MTGAGLRKPSGDVAEFGCGSSEIETRTINLDAKVRAV
jgi:hypothetical protein